MAVFKRLSLFHYDWRDGFLDKATNVFYFSVNPILKFTLIYVFNQNWIFKIHRYSEKYFVILMHNFYFYRPKIDIL